MKWVIEKQNGIRLEEGYAPFDPDKFKKIYFEWAGHGCGFSENGNFFVDNVVYDFKIGEGKIDPFQNKTAVLEFKKPNASKIISWNIGYEIEKPEGKEKYWISVDPQGHTTFHAERKGFKRQVRLM